MYIIKNRAYLKKVLAFSFCVVVFLIAGIKGEYLKSTYFLSDYCKFSVGDNIEWVKLDFDGSDWHQIHVSAILEDEGYSEYNDYAWYIKKIKIEDLSTKEPFYLILGKIDDVSVGYINDRLLAIEGNFPTNYETACHTERKYTIPKEMFIANSINTIAISVYDTHKKGGIVSEKIGIYDSPVVLFHKQIILKIGDKRKRIRRIIVMALFK